MSIMNRYFYNKLKYIIANAAFCVADQMTDTKIKKLGALIAVVAGTGFAVILVSGAYCFFMSQANGGIRRPQQNSLSGVLKMENSAILSITHSTPSKTQVKQGHFEKLE